MMTLAECRAIGELIRQPGYKDPRPEWLFTLPEADLHTSQYHCLLYVLAARHAPLNILELGTGRGTSACHFAAANPGGLVVSVDSDQEAKGRTESAWKGPAEQRPVCFTVDTRDARAVIPQVVYDIVFIDAMHTFFHAYSEYVTFRQMLRPHGLVVFDDIEYSPEMEAVWAMIPDPKVVVPHMHYTGFGVVQKLDGVEPLPVEEATAYALREGLLQL